jgi:hypothetical protein
VLRRLFLRCIVFGAVNGALFPAEALSADQADTQVRAYLVIPTHPPSGGADATAGLQVRQSENGLDFYREKDASSVLLFDLGVHFRSDSGPSALSLNGAPLFGVDEEGEWEFLNPGIVLPPTPGGEGAGEADSRLKPPVHPQACAPGAC